MLSFPGASPVTDAFARLAAAEERLLGPWSDALALNLLDRAGVDAGRRVLVIGSGAGHLALAAAERVGPSGWVMGIDPLPAATRYAESLASTRGLTWIVFRQMLLEPLELVDASFDVALCQLGLPYRHDPAAALAEMRRVLRPGGRLAFSVWGPPGRVPLLQALERALAVRLPVAHAYLQQGFRLSEAGTLAGLCARAGLPRASVEEISLPALRAGMDELWEALLEGGLRAGLSLREAPVAGRLAVREAWEHELSSAASGGAALSAVGLIVHAHV